MVLCNNHKVICLKYSQGAYRTKTYHTFSMYPVCLITVSCVCLDSQYRRQFIEVMYRERMYESLFENIPLTSQNFSPVGRNFSLL